ncbi:MAG: hypothetical protein R2874_15625 [Desulfobacterales bacterium]
MAIPFVHGGITACAFPPSVLGFLFAIFIIGSLISVLLARRLKTRFNLYRCIHLPWEKAIIMLTSISMTAGNSQDCLMGINDMFAKIRQTIARITEQKQELEAVLEGMAEGVMMLDKNGKIKAVNQALTRIAKCVPHLRGPPAHGGVSES